MFCTGQIQIKGDADASIEMMASVENLEENVTLNEECFPDRMDTESYKLVRLMIGKCSPVPGCEFEKFSAGEFSKNGENYRMFIGKFIFARSEESQLHKEINLFLYYSKLSNKANLCDISRSIAEELKEKL